MPDWIPIRGIKLCGISFALRVSLSLSHTHTHTHTHFLTVNYGILGFGQWSEQFVVKLQRRHTPRNDGPQCLCWFAIKTLTINNNYQRKRRTFCLTRNTARPKAMFFPSSHTSGSGVLAHVRHKALTLALKLARALSSLFAPFAPLSPSFSLCMSCTSWVL